MGNICGKTESEPFQSPGRVLGSAPPTGPRTAALPAGFGGPPRTLGGTTSSADPEAASADHTDARAKAAEAAQARARASVKSGGKLQAQLTERQREDLRKTVAKDAKLTADQRAADNTRETMDYN